MNDTEKKVKELCNKFDKETLEDAVNIYTEHEEDDSVDLKAVEDIAHGLKEVQLMRQGKLPKRAWNELLEELEGEVNE